VVAFKFLPQGDMTVEEQNLEFSDRETMKERTESKYVTETEKWNGMYGMDGLFSSVLGRFMEKQSTSANLKLRLSTAGGNTGIFGDAMASFLEESEAGACSTSKNSTPFGQVNKVDTPLNMSTTPPGERLDRGIGDSFRRDLALNPQSFELLTTIFDTLRLNKLPESLTTDGCLSCVSDVSVHD
jgi:hypothetical protein